MKYVIVGADGQLGQEWIKVLSNRGSEFSAYTFADLDITDFEKLDAVLENENPDVLINCAAYTAVDEAEDEIELANLINHTAVKKLAELSLKYKFRLVHYSTDYVFAGNIEDQNTYPDGYPEDVVPEPINEYGLSKWKGEQAIIESGCDFLILRLSWLCGAFGNNFVKTMLRLSKERDSLNVVNDQIGVPTFTSHTVRQSIQLIEQFKNGIYHLGSKGKISWYDFAVKIFELSKIDITVTPVSSKEYITKAKRPSFSKLSTKKIEKSWEYPQ